MTTGELVLVGIDEVVVNRADLGHALELLTGFASEILHGLVDGELDEKDFESIDTLQRTVEASA